VEASNVPAAIKAVREGGLEVVHLEELTSQPMMPSMRGVAEADLLLFYRQLATMVQSDTPLVEALRMLATESRSRPLSEAAAGLAAEVERGTMLSDAMAQRPRLFPATYVSLVRAAEAGGNLSETLNGIADHVETTSSLARRTSLAIIYPLLILIITGVLAMFVTTFILPKFADLFRELGVTEFPLPTRLLMWVGRVLPFLLVFLVVCALAIAAWIILARRTDYGRYWSDRRRLLIPLLGPLFRYAALSRCCTSLSALLAHGLGMLQSLRLAAAGAGNETIATGLRRCETAVADGGSLAEGLRAAGVFPSFMVSRIAVAEKGGSLPEAFLQLGRYYDQLLDMRTRVFAMLIEPLLLIGVGLCVLSAIVSLFLPLLSIISELSK
jgi:type IV pilus assembly protein PilC